MKTNISITIAFVALLLACSSQDEHGITKQTVGLFKNEPQSFNGYTLFSPSMAYMTYLINNKGQVVHTWKSNYYASAVYLLPNGHLLRNGIFPKSGGNSFGHNGSTERIEEYTWDGDLVWSYALSNEKYQLHHDIAHLNNGNILVIAYERQFKDEAIANGRNPINLSSQNNNEVWNEAIFEIKPNYETGLGGEIVWEWHLKDHLVQNHDPDKRNYYGENGISLHPGKVDYNYISPFGKTDWVHLNAIDYNPNTDQIMVSSPEFSELWIIDHNTTTQEAAGAKGDLVYRYGNPETFEPEATTDRDFYFQHNTHWINDGLPGAGNILVYNNGLMRNIGNGFSEVLELKPNMNKHGDASIVWRYRGSPKSSFFSPIVSSAQRLPNGNTLIDEGSTGRFFEVTPRGKTVWAYINPEAKEGVLKQGDEIPHSSILEDALKQGDEIPRAYLLLVPTLYSNLVFRANRYAPDYSGLQDKDLTPIGPIER